MKKNIFKKILLIVGVVLLVNTANSQDPAFSKIKNTKRKKYTSHIRRNRCTKSSTITSWHF